MRGSILIVDDNYMVLESLVDFLSFAGFSVELAPDASSALRVLKEKTFDIFIIDYEMPGVNGLVLTEEVRRLFPNTYIIGISGKDVKEEFLKAGANTFLIKPLRYKNILSIIPHCA